MRRNEEAELRCIGVEEKVKLVLANHKMVQEGLRKLVPQARAHFQERDSARLKCSASQVQLPSSAAPLASSVQEALAKSYGYQRVRPWPAELATNR